MKVRNFIKTNSRKKLSVYLRTSKQKMLKFKMYNTLRGSSGFVVEFLKMPSLLTPYPTTTKIDISYILVIELWTLVLVYSFFVSPYGCVSKYLGLGFNSFRMT